MSLNPVYNSRDSRSGYRDPRKSSQHGQRTTHDPRGGLRAGYLEGGYFAEDDNLRPQVMQEDAEYVANMLAQARARDFSVSQFRRFYDHVKALEKKLDLMDGNFRAIEGELRMLKAFAADARAKDKVPEIFREFITANVDLVMNKKDFLQGFIPHLQAVLAYYNYESLKNRGRR